ncbi:glycosyltransferase family 2 protein [Methylocystis heyeri]|uniref:Glycosyltransferase n=1 Tax=Methylocystis heyeri TaxID=391905 RepID=A0A6B8KKC3_9HYPH|nr:glycosyltransferase family 2 protein [Methylocystis heyeri]QGM47053.1 glycosyltransferase [Methylocystis heyeri]
MSSPRPDGRISENQAKSPPRHGDRRRAEGADASVFPPNARLRDGFASEKPTPRPLPQEIAFLAAFGAPGEVLLYASALARRQGVSADAALLAEGLMAEESFYRLLAAHLGVRFLEQGFRIASSADAAHAEELGYAPLAPNPLELRWLFAPKGAAIGTLIGAARGKNARPLFAVTTRSRFLKALEQEPLRRAAAAAPFCAERADPELCARGAIGRSGAALAAFSAALPLACLFLPFGPAALGAALLLAALFLVSVFTRLLAGAASFERDERNFEIADAELPVYSIIAPLYREAAVVRQLSSAIDGLDYPRAKLDVVFMVEEDDLETQAALRLHGPAAPHRVIVAPAGAPKTKPRAMNIAAPFLRGALVTVYDAEDMPEPRQLRRAAALFRRLPGETACLQASLCIHNGGQNALTAHFALEYAALFDVFNKGSSVMGTPMFLGGTSNHFRIEALAQLGFWDAYNVTEDADLGLRLARAGYLIRTFDSETYEEAPARLKALLNQRSRWLKGWMQTALTHCRNPRRFIRDLGPARALATIGLFAGGLAGPLLGLPLTLALFINCVFGNLLAPVTGAEIALSTLWCSLALFGAAAILFPLVLGMARRRLWRLWPALLITPFWLLMLTAAAWRALWELWREPYYWRKTEHGLAAKGEGRQSA